MEGHLRRSIPWNSATNNAQYSKWAAAPDERLHQRDILTTTNNIDQFTSGKAAMIVDGTWDTQKFTDSMGKNVAAFVPPFSNSPIKGVVEYPGDGFSIMNYSSTSSRPPTSWRSWPRRPGSRRSTTPG